MAATLDGCERAMPRLTLNTAELAVAVDTSAVLQRPAEDNLFGMLCRALAS